MLPLPNHQQPAQNMSKEHIKAWGLTHVGNIRTNNEDAFYLSAEEGALAVSDGMGGAAAGEVASGMTIQGFQTFLQEESARLKEHHESPHPAEQQQLLEALSASVQKSHEAIVARQKKERDKRGMGCTFTGLLLTGGKALIAHAGDTRAYLIRGQGPERVHLLTTDHNIAQLLLSTTDMTPEQVAEHKNRHVLTNAVGVTAPLTVETLAIDIMPGDYFLLCSDGLHEYFPDDQELGEVLDQFPGEAACQELCRRALERGGHDNITVLIAQVEANLSIEEGEVCDIREELSTFSHVREQLGLSRSEFLRFLTVSMARSLADGEAILTPDQPGRGFLVLKGTLQKEDSQTTRKEGSFLGARTLASGAAPKRCWRSIGPSRVLVFERASLRRLCLTQPVLGARILWGILELD